MKKGVTKKQAVVRLILIILLAVVLFFAAFKLGSYVLGNLFGASNNVVEVPMLIGSEQEEAKRMLEELNLVMKIGSPVESEYPAGYVAKQSYAEGYKLKEGAEVEVNISKGGKVVLVPNVKDSTLDAAKIQIEQRGLVFAVEEKNDNNIPSGDIIGQNPEVNTEVAVGSVVTVYVSKGVGDGLIRVPDVVGKTEAEASKIISDSKLIPEITTISNEAKEDGKIVSQIPEKDAVVSELTTVVIVVNKLEKEEEPVVGDKEDDNKDNTNKEDDNPLTNGKKRTIQVNLSNKERESFVVKVTVESTLLGTRVEYERLHSRSDGLINVEVTDAPGAYLRVYIDDKLDSEMRL